MAQDQKGIAIGDNRKDYSGRINANFNLLDDLLEIGLHTEYREAYTGISGAVVPISTWH